MKMGNEWIRTVCDDANSAMCNSKVAVENHDLDNMRGEAQALVNLSKENQWIWVDTLFLIYTIEDYEKMKLQR